MNEGLKAVIRVITTTLVIVAMLFAFAISGIRLLGFDIYGVLSGSMEPTYPTGSLIYVREVDPADLRVNDVITYSMSGGTVVTHRIVEMVPNEGNPGVYSYRTKGDANKDVDSALVNSYNIIGKVIFHLPGMGYVAQYIQSPPGMYVAIGACAAMIAFVFITDDMMKEKPGKKKKGKKKSALNLAGAAKMLPGKKQSASAARAQAKRQQAPQYDEDEAYDEEDYAPPRRAPRQQPQDAQQYARPQQPQQYARPQQQYARAQQPQQYARPQQPQQQQPQRAPRVTYEMLTPAQKDWYQEMIRRGYSHEQIMAHVQQQYDQQYAARQNSRTGRG